MLRGMAETLHSGGATCLMEFAPDAISTRTDCVEWLGNIALTHDIYDVQSDVFLQPAGVVPIAAAAIAEYVRMLLTQTPDYSDLLLIPKNLPGRDRLRERLPGVQRTH